MSAYRVLQGLSYPPGRRAEPGDVIDDLPKASVRWLLKRGAIVAVPEPDPPAPPYAREGGDDR